MLVIVLIEFMLIIVQGYIAFGRFDKFNDFVAGSGHFDFVQVSPVLSTLWIYSQVKECVCGFSHAFLNLFESYVCIYIIIALIDLSFFTTLEFDSPLLLNKIGILLNAIYQIVEIVARLHFSVRSI